MAGIDLHSPEHPPFPHNAELLRDPNRAPTEHERYIAEIMTRFQNPPDFSTLPPATPDERAAAIARLEELAAMPPETIQDQDDRIVAMCATIAVNPAVFGESGYYLASEIMRACKTIETSEFRRAFMRDYVPQIENVRKYLHELASLRRRAKRAEYDAKNVPPGRWGNPERRAAAREQMELVQNLPDHKVMEKYWRMMEIVCQFPDLFAREQYDKLKNNAGIEQTWKAHLAKARDDLNFYNAVVLSGAALREVVQSSVKVLKELAEARGRMSSLPPDAGQV
jgi:hypothetical protein